MANQSVPLYVRSGEGSQLVSYENKLYGEFAGFTDEIEIVERVPIQRAGWQAVRYKGKTYQLLGGIRTPYYIKLRK